MIIGKVLPEDIEQMVEVGRKFYNETYHVKYGPFEEQKIRRMIKTANEQPNKLFVAYDKAGDIITGFVVGVYTELPFSNTKVVQDMGVYVAPDKRGTSLGIKLIKLLEKWSLDQKADCTIICHNTGINTEQSIPLFKRLGYFLGGHIFVKENK